MKSKPVTYSNAMRWLLRRLTRTVAELTCRSECCNYIVKNVKNKKKNAIQGYLEWLIKYVWYQCVPHVQISKWHGCDHGKRGCNVLLTIHSTLLSTGNINMKNMCAAHSFFFGKRSGLCNTWIAKYSKIVVQTCPWARSLSTRKNSATLRRFFKEVCEIHYRWCFERAVTVHVVYIHLKPFERGGKNNHYTQQHHDGLSPLVSGHLVNLSLDYIVLSIRWSRVKASPLVWKHTYVWAFWLIKQMQSIRRTTSMYSTVAQRWKQ